MPGFSNVEKELCILPFENLLRNFGLKSLTNNYQSFSPGSDRNIIEINKHTKTI